MASTAPMRPPRLAATPLVGLTKPARQVGGYAEARPTGVLSRCVEAVWVYQTPSPGAAGVAHRILPEPAVNLSIVGHARAGGGLDNPRLLFQGPIRSSSWYKPQPGEDIAAVRLAPEVSSALLGVSAFDHTDQMNDVSNQLGDWAKRLIDTLASAATPYERAKLLCAAIAQKAGAHFEGGTPATHGAQLIRRTQGRVRMKALSAQLNISERHLRRLLRDALGVRPKTYARHLRLKHAIECADTETRPDWARIAAIAGYTDQSHLIADACALAGASPRSLHQERRVQPMIEPHF